ncbi:protein FAR1-RELATED SEQUENCE 11-like [Daucus carota subsp. sativus]|uniref:protein FAR1-RELATED SEQUENCE 11-like n=1 Tax=Daucus carota subsp. sativus TaxID=79200 RepID=UPI003083909F
MNMNIIDLNKPCQEAIQEEQEVIEQEYEQESECINFEPFTGQCFLSEEEAYLFYHKYAKQHGFSVRKTRFDKNKDGKIKRRDFVCHREGFQQSKIADPVMKQRNTASTRCDCKAHMRVKLKKSFEIFPEQWHVTEFVAIHNHELLSQEEVRFLPSYRFMTNDDEKRILLLKDGGLNVKQIMRVIELEKNVRHGHLSFTSKDVHNFFSRFRTEKAKNDVLDFLEYCKIAKKENKNFQYCVKLDDERKINAYDMPLGIFVGVDNHGRSILFGCALLRNETKSTFSWLMRTFVSMMKKTPKSILTDQDPWMTQAIAEEMPLTKHAFCIWHITSKFAFNKTCLLLDTQEEFENRWPQVIEKYKLEKNKHVVGLHSIRHSWVPSYLREHFFAGMTTTGRCESFNAFIKRFTTSRICLSLFIKQVDLAIEDIEQNQLQVRMLEKYRGASLRTLSPLEEQHKTS